MTENETKELILEHTSYTDICEKIARLEAYENMIILSLQILAASEDLEAAKKELEKLLKNTEYNKFNKTLEQMRRDIGPFKEYRLHIKS